MARIYKKNTKIDHNKTHEFFENRGKNVNSDHPLTSILYQDNNPSLAEERDLFEKNSVIPMLQLTGDDNVLDMGCGIGRWAEVANTVNRYHGIDFSESLIEIAKSKSQLPNVTFQCLAAEDISPSSLDNSIEFTKVIVAGLLIYLNDASVKDALSGIAQCCSSRAQVYLREPVAMKDRLTLQNNWSEELTASYSAIYRTKQEMYEMFNETLVSAGFKLQFDKPLYPEHLNNRIETQQRIYMFQRP